MEICKGLKALYDKYIFHGNLNPSNILMFENSLKIIDFKMSKQLEYEGKNLDVDNYGTLEYMAIEAIKDHIYCLLTDIWSLGVIL